MPIRALTKVFVDMTKIFVNNTLMIPKQRRPTEAELAILRVLWEAGPGTVRDILAVLNRSKRTGFWERPGQCGSHTRVLARGIGDGQPERRCAEVHIEDRRMDGHTLKAIPIAGLPASCAQLCLRICRSVAFAWVTLSPPLLSGGLLKH